MTGADGKLKQDVGALESSAAAALHRLGVPETNLEFLSRRALEESRLAQEASSAAAAAAHRYLAAAYSSAMAKEIAAEAELGALILRVA